MIESNQEKQGESQLPLFNFIRDKKPTSDNSKIVELIPDALIGCCQNGKINYWNKQSETLFGWTKKEAFGQSIEKLLTPPGFLNIRHQKGQPDQSMDLTALHKNGSKIPIELNLKILNHRGKDYFFAFVRECSKKNSLAHQFRSLNKQNQILKKLLSTVSDSSNKDEVICIFLEELAQFKQCELAFVCKKDFGHFTRLEFTCNRTQLIFKDFSAQVDVELKKLAKKDFPAANEKKEIEWIENVQSEWDSPFFIFGRNFGFHGCLVLPIQRPNKEWIYLFFLSTQFMEISETEQEFLKESIKNLESTLSILGK